MREANVITNRYNFSNKLHDYTIETTKMANVTGCSRSALLVKDGIKYIRRADLEDEITSNVWVKVTTDRQPVLIMSGYRQWHLPKKYGIANSGSSEQRMRRFRYTLDKWQLALAEKKILL